MIFKNLKLQGLLPVPKKVYNITTQYDADHLFDIVANIEAYPEFLPWVAAARILDTQENIIIAELLIRYKVFRGSYVSKVTLIPKQEIIVELVDGPFKHLNNYWKFNGNEVEFKLDFELKSSLLENLISNEFEHYAGKMMDAFNKRAKDTYKV
jgi:coenzyme Q-binding protein COQ10